MKNKNLHHISFLHKDLNRWNYPEPILVLLLFFPSKENAESMTDLERLGIWASRQERFEAECKISRQEMLEAGRKAAKKAREEALRLSQIDQEIPDDSLREE